MSASAVNHRFRVVWNTTKACWQAVPEHAGGAPSCARGRGRAGRGRRTRVQAVALLLAPLWPWPVLAADVLPTGGQVVSGQARLQQSGNLLTVQQGTDKAAIDWRSFSIGPGQKVLFIQPSATAVGLNRVTGGEASVIQGALQANGRVFLVNPNGVLFSPTAQVDVGGLVASTQGLAHADLQAGIYRLAGNSTASVVNQGQIQAAEGGVVALVAAQIVNSGRITAPAGQVLLGAGNRVLLDLGGPAKLEVEAGALATAIEQSGRITADGGQVLLTTRAAGDLATSVINHSGLTQARTLATGAQGQIVLLADMGQGRTLVNGTLDASAPTAGTHGGFIETSGAQVKVADAAQVSTRAATGAAAGAKGGTATGVVGKNGTWLIDPHDFTIAASGGDMSGAAVGTALASGNLEIQSSRGATSAGSGNVNVNDTVAWSANTLTLTAANHVNLNAVMTASGTAGLVLNTATANGADAGVPGGTVLAALGPGGFSGRVDFTGSGNTLRINGQTYTLVRSAAELLALDASLRSTVNSSTTIAGHIALASDIDMASAGTQAKAVLGDAATPLSGVLEGLGHTVRNLQIASAGAVDSAGLVARTAAGAQVRNLGVADVLVSVPDAASAHTGALVGQHAGTLRNVYATGVVAGNDATGGLVGTAASGAVLKNAQANVVVSGRNAVGGLVGAADGASIEQSYAKGSATGTGQVGGLVGRALSSVLSQVFATGNVSASGAEAGGLAGRTEGGSISNAYAMGAVGATGAAGGLVGTSVGTAVDKAYAAGVVSGGVGQTGALVGDASSGSTGLADTYWDSDTTGQSSAVGAGSASGSATGLAHALMQQSASFSNWAVALSDGSGAVWRLYPGQTYPLLENLRTRVWVTPSHTATYNGSAQGNTGTVSYSNADLNPLAVTGTASYTGTGTQVGSYTLTVSGLQYAGQDYVLANAPGSLAITPATLTLGTVTAANKVYDASATATASASLVGVYGSDAVTVAVGANFSDAQAGTGKTVTVSSLALAGAAAGNYTLATTPGQTTTADITPRTLTLATGSAASRAYDGTRDATVTAGSLSGLVGSETLNVAGTGLFNTKDVGTAKAVTATYTLADGLNGGRAGNYQLASSTQTLSADITPREVTLAVGSVADKVYDGTRSATVTAGAVQGLVAGEALTILASGQFDTADVGSGKAVPASYTAANGVGSGGAVTGLASNYRLLTTSEALTGRITPRELTLDTGVAAGKVYDGNRTAEVSPGALNGLVPGQSLTVTASGLFDTKDAGTAKSVAATYRVGDAAAGSTGLASNYRLTTTSETLSADITPREITLDTGSAASRAYDGTRSTAVTAGTVSGLVAGERITIVGQGTFDTKDVGTAKAVTAEYSTADAPGNTGRAANYRLLTTSETLSADITPRDITLATGTAAHKVYDGQTTATVTPGAVQNIVAGERLTITASAEFADKNAGTAKTVTVAYAAADASDAQGNLLGQVANYRLLTTGEQLQADITPRTLALTPGSVVGKVYDGSRTAAVTPGALSGMVAGERLGVAATGSFDTANAGTGKTVTATYTLSDAADGSGLAANYQLPVPTETLSADIARRAVVVTPQPQRKVVYTADPVLTYTVEAQNGSRGLVAGEQLAGALGRTPTERLGDHALLPGSMDAQNPNYAITYQPAALTILPVPKDTPLYASVQAGQQAALAAAAPTAGQATTALELADTGVAARATDRDVTGTVGSPGLATDRGARGGPSGNGPARQVDTASAAGFRGLSLLVQDGGIQMPTAAEPTPARGNGRPGAARPAFSGGAAGALSPSSTGLSSPAAAAPAPSSAQRLSPPLGAAVPATRAVAPAPVGTTRPAAAARPNRADGALQPLPPGPGDTRSR